MKKEIEDTFQISVDRILEYIENYSGQIAERNYIESLLFYHECEPSAAAERISREYDLDYAMIVKLMP